MAGGGGFKTPPSETDHPKIGPLKMGALKTGSPNLWFGGLEAPHVKRTLIKESRLKQTLWKEGLLSYSLGALGWLRSPPRRKSTP